MTLVKELKVTKLIDTTASQPGSGSKFTYFGAPSFDGTTVVFYGCNAPEGAPNQNPPTWEGIYCLRPVFGSELTKVSDNHTSLPTLDGNPSSNHGENLRAYVQTATNGALNPNSALKLQSSRPAVTGDYIAFFAANWTNNNAGIFLYHIGTKEIKVVASNGINQNFEGGQFWPPTMNGSGICFTGSSPQNNPGVYLSNFNLSTTKNILDISRAQTPEGKSIAAMTQSHYDGKTLYLYGQYADLNEAIFTYIPATGILTPLVSEDLPVSSAGHISRGNNTFFTELAFSGPQLAFQAQISGGGNLEGGLFKMNLTDGEAPQLLATDEDHVPGAPAGVFFNGNQFATPPVTDGERVVFAGFFNPPGAVPEQIGLFLAKGNSLFSVLPDGLIDNKTIANIYLNTDCFVNGILACTVYFSDNSYGVYLLDLTRI